MTNSCVLQGFIHELRFIILTLIPFTAIFWHNEVDFQLCPGFMHIYFQVAAGKLNTTYSYYFHGHQYSSVK